MKECWSKGRSPFTLPPPQQEQEESSQDLRRNWKFITNYPQNQIIGNASSEKRIKSSLNDICNNLAFISQIEPKNIHEVKIDKNCMVMQKEFLKEMKFEN